MLVYGRQRWGCNAAETATATLKVAVATTQVRTRSADSILSATFVTAHAMTM